MPGVMDEMTLNAAHSLPRRIHPEADTADTLWRTDVREIQMIKIGPYSFEDYLHLVESFHGNVAPGLVIGGFMVDLALKRMPEGVLLDAICETTTCLPDAIQLLTPCTVGNGWLKIFNLGRFALSLYGKEDGTGIRVFLDAAKLEAWPEVKAWLFKLKPKREQDREVLLGQMREAGPGICGVQPIQVKPRYLKKNSRGRIVICAVCGEPYPAQDGATCRACQGDTPYASIAAWDGGNPQAFALGTVAGKQGLREIP